MDQDTQFEQILDEAVALLQQGKTIEEIVAIYPAQAQELRELLSVAEVLQESKSAAADQLFFNRVLKSLPETARSARLTKTNSFNLFFMNLFKRPIKFSYVAVPLVLVLLVGGLAAFNFITQQLEPATTEEQTALPRGSAGYGLDATSGLGEEKAQMVGEALGLGTRDIRESVPIIGKYLMRSTAGPVTDNREFLKTDYQATIKTRKVEELTPRVQTIIRGYGGRVDSASVNDRSAYVSFVVPKRVFEVFKLELKGLARARFITESTRQDNLLPQKQVIEKNTALTSDDLETLQKDRAALVSRHNAIVASLQRQISILARVREALEAEATTDPVRQAYILSRLTEIPKEQSRLRSRLAAENAQYTRELNSFDARIRNAESRLTNLAEQDQNLLDTVETVSGTVALEWIGIWEMFNLYIPHLWAWLLAAASAFFVYRHYSRREAVESVERE